MVSKGLPTSDTTIGHCLSSSPLGQKSERIKMPKRGGELGFSKNKSKE
jgi:hypothetical protein